MELQERNISAQIEYLRSKAAALIFLVKLSPPYNPNRHWLPVEGLALRAIDDLYFLEETPERVLMAFTAEPPHESGVQAIAVPLQAALERTFFHIQGVSKLVINPAFLPEGLSPLQADIDFTLPDGFGESCEFSREEMAEAIGSLTHAPSKKRTDYLARAKIAYGANSLFEAFADARKARREKGDPEAWHFELMAMSFLGLPERAVELYEHYPARDGADPYPLLLAARFRLLLKQFNEACTILHTLTFKEEVAPVAFAEMARAFVMTGEFSRAVDAASTSIEKDSHCLDAYLVRGIALRGLSYDSGDEEGLKAALKDFEHVAKKAVYNAAEALFHAGTIFARLGDLTSAESSLRQSLFQRDRFASRDALVRVTCAAHKVAVAREETALIERLIPHLAKPLRELLDSHVGTGAPQVAGEQSEIDDLGSALWSADEKLVHRAAAHALKEWNIQVANTGADAALFDDFVNYFAPAGIFSARLEYGYLNDVGTNTVARVFAIHLARVFARGGTTEWRGDRNKPVSLFIRASGGTIPLESFVNDRILLGASADNFASLESLSAELLPQEQRAARSLFSDTWEAAKPEELAFFESEAQWAREKLTGLGASIKGSVSDLFEIDRCINLVFEPGGELSEHGATALGSERDRFIAALGFMVGKTIDGLLAATWARHPDLEGVSLSAGGLGRVFPVARVQRRAHLGSAADFSAQLGSFAFGIGAAVVADELHKGSLTDTQQVRARLTELLPVLETFPNSEINSLVESLVAARQQ
jgi:hypothetical protein